MNQKENESTTSVPTFKELIAPLFGENPIMDPCHVMALVKLPGKVVEKLEDNLGKLEFFASTKAKAEVALTELKTVLRERYRYEIDVELVASALYHLDKVFGDYNHNVTAYYWPTAEPVVFVFGGEYGSTALVVAPKIEVSIKEGEQASPSPSSSPGGGEG
jgi:hypothetical protein